MIEGPELAALIRAVHSSSRKPYKEIPGLFFFGGGSGVLIYSRESHPLFLTLKNINVLTAIMRPQTAG